MSSSWKSTTPRGISTSPICRSRRLALRFRLGLGLAQRAAHVQVRARWLAAQASRFMLRPVCPACGGGDFGRTWSDQSCWVEACSACGLGLTFPRKRPTAAGALHRQVYSDPAYVARYLANYAPYLSSAYRRGIQRIRLRAPQAASLLDIGCGFGFFMQLARSAGFRTDGVEIAPELACEAARRYGLRVHTGNLSNAPSHLRGYDVVTAWDVLEHCPDPHLVIQEVARRMLPGGLVLLRVPDFSFASRGLPPDFVKRYLGGMYPLDPDQH